MSFLRHLYLAYFSHPSHERFLYRGLRKWGCRSIVEFGVGDGQRTRRLLEQSTRTATGGKIRYTGIDLFESRSCQPPGLSLKRAHQMFQGPHYRIQLAPGDPWTVLSRLANTLRDTDLMLVHADQDAESMARAWFFVPRMLHERSRVFIERLGERGSAYECLSISAIRQLAERVERAERGLRAA